MSQPIDEITGKSGGSNVQKTLEKWGYTPGKGFASTSSQSNTGNNTTHENSNDKLNKSAVSSKDAGSIGGGINAATITQAQSSDTNNSAGNNSSGGMKHRASDMAQFGIASKKGSFDPNKSGISFPNMDSNVKKLAVAAQRVGQEFSQETLSQLDPDAVTEKTLQAYANTTKANLAEPVEKQSSHLEAFSDSTDIQ